MFDILKKLHYDFYLVLLGVLSFLSYTGTFDDIGFPIYLFITILIALVLILKNYSVLYILPLFMFIQMGFADLRDNVEVTGVYSIVFLSLLLTDVVLNRNIKKVGVLFLPLAILTVVSIATFFNAPDTFTWFAGFSQVLTVLVLYLYFVNTINDDPENVMKVAKVFMYSAMLVSIEMLHYISLSDLDPITVIRTRTINLGWENLNIIIYNNILSIPLIAYIITKVKVKLPYMIFSFIGIVGILLTLSRSSILTLGVMILLLIPWMLVKDKNRVSLMIQGVIALITLFVLGYLLEQNQEIITEYFDSLFGRDLLRYEDRWVLLEIAWEKFLEYPVFGSGGLYSSRVHLSSNGALNYHNTIAQVSTLGITGLIAFIYLFVVKTKLIIRKKHDFKWPLLVLIFTTAFINGSLQPMYFYITYMAFIFLLLAIYENSKETA